MNEVIVYLLKVIALQGLLFAFHWFFHRKSTLHSYNRCFLMGSLLLAFVVPFISISLPEKITEVSDVIQDSPVAIWLSEPTTSNTAFEWITIKTEKGIFGSLLPWVYGVIAVVLLARSLAYLFVLRKLKKHSEPIQKEGFTLFKTSHPQSFSFFSDVFIPRPLFGSDAFDQVLAHECVHVRQLHSLDRLLLDFFVSLFWFNPFIYLYRNALIEIHEYQADEGVLRQFNDLIRYQEVLYSQLQSPSYSGLVSHFNFQMIKKRIVMMNKQKKRNGWIYFLTVPLMGVMIFAFSSKEAMKPLNDVGNEISTMLSPIAEKENHYDDLWSQDYTPSILPLNETEMIRMSSGFGMRMHPIEKVRKMHKGMDFSCKVGSEILATADGTVSEIRNNTDGYGKMVVIEHGDEFVTRYAQLSQFKVMKGDQVRKGQVIALSGNSGKSTAPHLHYEVLRRNNRVNPALFINNYEFTSKELKHSHQVKEEVEGTLSKSNKELIKKEQELARREAELEAKEKEFYLAKEHLVKEEIERAKTELIKSQEEEKQRMKTLESPKTNEGKSTDIETITILKSENKKDDFNTMDEKGIVKVKTKKKNKLKKKDK